MNPPNKKPPVPYLPPEIVLREKQMKEGASNQVAAKSINSLPEPSEQKDIKAESSSDPPSSKDRKPPPPPSTTDPPKGESSLRPVPPVKPPLKRTPIFGLKKTNSLPEESQPEITSPDKKQDLENPNHEISTLSSSKQEPEQLSPEQAEFLLNLPTPTSYVDPRWTSNSSQSFRNLTVSKQYGHENRKSVRSLKIPQPSPAPQTESPSQTSKKSSGRSTSRDWNSEWQTLLDMPDSLTKYAQLKELSNDFNRSCTIYASIIISELFLDHDSKTIKPLDTHGVAGGLKYLWEGIFFKLAVDQKIGNIWIYGGVHRCDEKAMKSASHELNGAAWCLSANIEGLHVPLMTLINHKGFRIVCIAEIPLVPESTPLYGSNDAGATIFNDLDPTLTQKIQQLAQALNLSPHQAQGKTIYGPTDLEGHKAKDGRYYLLDFARLFPPEANPEDFLIQLLRPELIQKNKVPLMSDAHTPFNDLSDPLYEDYQNDVCDATEKLRRTIIPEFARSVESQLGSKNFKSCDPMALVRSAHSDLLFLLDGMHKNGINIRYLGAVRLNIKAYYPRAIIFVEMVARALSNLLRLHWRNKMSEIRYLSDTPFVQIAINLFNLVFNDHANLLTEFNKSAMYVWDGSVEFSLIKSLLTQKFRTISLSMEERDNNFDLRESLNLPLLFSRLAKLTGVVFNTKTTEEFLCKFPHIHSSFFLDEVVQLKAVQKHFKIAQLAETMSLLLRADSEGLDTQTRLRLLSLATASFETGRYLNEKMMHMIATKREEVVQSMQFVIDRSPSAQSDLSFQNILLRDLKLLNQLPSLEIKKLYDCPFISWHASYKDFLITASIIPLNLLQPFDRKKWAQSIIRLKELCEKKAISFFSSFFEAGNLIVVSRHPDVVLTDLITLVPFEKKILASILLQLVVCLQQFVEHDQTPSFMSLDTIFLFYDGSVEIQPQPFAGLYRQTPFWRDLRQVIMKLATGRNLPKNYSIQMIPKELSSTIKQFNQEWVEPLLKLCYDGQTNLQKSLKQMKEKLSSIVKNPTEAKTVLSKYLRDQGFHPPTPSLTIGQPPPPEKREKSHTSRKNRPLFPFLTGSTSTKKQPKLNSQILTLGLFGNGGVGKSALVLRFLKDNFTEEYSPSMEERYKKQVMIDDKTVFVEILDTAGQEEYVSLREGFMRSVEFMIFVYSLTDQLSFDATIQMVQQANMVRWAEHRNLDGSILIGTKSDLFSERQVDKDAPSQLANQYGLKNFEVSSFSMHASDIWNPIIRHCLSCLNKKL